METKELSEKIRELIDESKSVEKDLVSFLEQELNKIIKYYEKTESFIRELVNDLLETIRMALSSKETRDIEQILSRSAHVMLESVKKAVYDALEEARKAAEKARERLDRAVEKTLDMDKIEEDVKKDLDDAYRELLEKLKTGKARLREAQKALEEFRERNAGKLEGKAEEELKEAVDKARKYVQGFEEETREHLEKLVQHSNDKVDSWLKQMGKKAEEENK